jgi:hypothetical protein
MEYRLIARLLGCLAAVFLALGVASCATAPSGGERGESASDEAARAEAAASEALEGRSSSRLPQIPEGEDVPSWIETYPSDDEYYIGVGGFAESDDRAELLERGRLSALRALAAEISTEIRSELRAVTREDSEGRSYDSSTLIMNAMVEEELQGVEVVDSYYSERIGQWFYLRLSKEEYRRYQREETARLEQRLASLVAPVAGSSDVTAAQELATLFRALGIAVESPYAGEANISVAGTEGYAADVLVTRIQTVLDGLQLRPRRSALSTLPGNPAELVIEASAPGRSAGAGRIPFIIESSAADPIEVRADGSGAARTSIPTAGLSPGTYPVTAAVSLDAVTAAEQAPSVDVSIPQTSLTLEVRPLSVHISVQAEGGGNLPGMEGYLRQLVSGTIPVSFADGAAASEGTLDFTVQYRELPENDYGLVFVFAHAVLDARRGGENVASYRTPEVKEGGLDTEQALSRAVSKLQDHLAGDREFERTLETFALGR